MRILACICLGLLLTSQPIRPASQSPELMTGVIGMYVHQHWPYNHPYAARTWTLEDWRGYADGLKKLGYNTIMIWPLLEIMPQPLTASDRASLEKHSRVIDLLHREFGMKVLVVLCPNIVANGNAAKATYETRHFFFSDVLVDPSNAQAVDKMIAWREKLFSYLKAADGVAIIDSDPGGYPGSTNAQFVSLLLRHREMLNRLRPGIELDYWVHAGWQAYARFHSTGILKWGTEPEFVDVISRLRQANPEPWGLANGLKYAEKLNLGSRVISYNYGRIEAEPSLPLTNFGGEAAYDGGSHPGPRGVMGNAQTHCIQLPNTFAFVRGALGKPVAESDYVQFANDLIEAHGKLIVDSWKALAGTDASRMRAQVTQLQQAVKGNLQPGALKGLLFGSPQRFLRDLIMQLELRAAYQDFLHASKGEGPIKPALSAFVSAAQVWQTQLGYQDHWEWPGMYDALRRLHSPDIDRLLKTNVCILTCAEDVHPIGHDPVHAYLADQETFTPQLIAAMQKALSSMRN